MQHYQVVLSQITQIRVRPLRSLSLHDFLQFWHLSIPSFFIQEKYIQHVVSVQA
ncbi:MAG: hypothetical protein GY951_16990 [Psychromonas sp.]|nr:hypothetical protein [Alteromonadales bacterium]MCP5079735.1 hypothetical protein [Psychromonas sp.]